MKYYKIKTSFVSLKGSKTGINFMIFILIQMHAIIKVLDFLSISN